MSLSRKSLIAISLVTFALPLGAQVETPPTGVVADSQQIMAVMANSMRMMKPAEVVLAHKAELGLTPEQVSLLEFLAQAQRDSVKARSARRMADVMDGANNRKPSSAAVSAVSWTGPLDEKAIREQACEQAKAGVEITLDMYRDRHAVGAVLTPAQAAQMPMLEAQDMMKAFRRQ